MCIHTGIRTRTRSLLAVAEPQTFRTEKSKAIFAEAKTLMPGGESA
jgi:hypothetical protein